MLIIRRSNCIIQHLVSSHSVGGRPDMQMNTIDLLKNKNMGINLVKC